MLEMKECWRGRSTVRLISFSLRSHAQAGKFVSANSASNGVSGMEIGGDNTTVYEESVIDLRQEMSEIRNDLRTDLSSIDYYVGL